MDEKPKQIENFQEIIGVLKKIQDHSGRMILTFIIKTKVKLPNSPGLKEQLKQYVGKKIGILRLNNQYVVGKIRE